MDILRDGIPAIGLKGNRDVGENQMEE